MKPCDRAIARAVVESSPPDSSTTASGTAYGYHECYRSRVPERRVWPRIATALALTAIAAVSFAQRWAVLGASPFPLGVDGYYYPIQLRALLEHGHLAYSALPLAFWWMAPFAAATDPITGAKLGAALGGALVALPAYGLGARLGGGRGPGIVAAAVAACSEGSTYLSIEFAKQGIALTVALAALLAVLRALDQRSRLRLAIAVAAIAATCLAHKLAAALVVVAAIPAAIEHARGRGALRGRRLLYVIGGGALALAVLAAALAIAGVIELSLIGEAVTSDVRWDLPALTQPELHLGYETIAALVVAIGAIAALVTDRGAVPSAARALAWTMIAIAIVIALPFLAANDPQGLVLRLRASSFVPLALLAAFVAGRLRPLAQAIFGEARVAGVAAMTACAVLAGVAAVWPRDRHAGEVLAHPALVASALALDEHVPSGKTVIVPERHVEYMIAWYTRAPVSARPEAVPRNERVRVLLPLSPAASPFPLEPALAAARREPLLDPPIGLHPRHKDGFVVVTEATWEWIVAQLPARSRRHWLAWPTI